eukprot:TRINITY_DN6351_c0_g3_i1.p1 TRINITY_DN6351_c0_g3~~TRINITY_DN6351_c0_g3_i1.p1  ORF type:complete len:596 (-),score=82.66 TRINITY_DN6351_c0_g3_i1:144-1931(-)
MKDKKFLLLSLLINLFLHLCDSSPGRETVFTTQSTLTHELVNPEYFGLLKKLPVEGQIYAQPLVITSTNGKYLLVATMNNTLYLYDIGNNHELLWKKQFESPCPLPDNVIGVATCGNYTDITERLGILSTPVVDGEKATIYFVTYTCSPVGPGVNTNHQHIIHAVHINNGSDVVPSRVINPNGIKGSRVPFYSNTSNQRAALSLHGGYVYVSFASFCDAPFYAGWIVLLNQSTLSLDYGWNTALNQGGIWQSGSPLKIDNKNQFLYVSISNGNFDEKNEQFSNSIVKLLPSYQQNAESNIVTDLNVTDWFHPDNSTFPSVADQQSFTLGTTDVIFINEDTIVTGTKEGYAFVLDASNLGKFSSNNSNAIQILRVLSSGNFSFDLVNQLLVWKNSNDEYFLYVIGVNSTLKMFKFHPDTRQFSSTPDQETTWRSPSIKPSPTISLSSDSTNRNAILWIVMPSYAQSLGKHGNIVADSSLIAVQAENIVVTLWNSSNSVHQNNFGNQSKFNPVAIHGGFVYVPTFSDQLCIYGVFHESNKSVMIAVIVIGVIVLLVLMFAIWWNRRYNSSSVSSTSLAYHPKRRDDLMQLVAKDEDL